ncbi:cytochrome P460 family protein [Methanolobus sp. ZRKC3]|uniref:cytochrome P460 family protein n=1 Tax=Methanolobus sp. ZRKC3 TaxID=3125786 RepID=UPI003246B872
MKRILLLLILISAVLFSGCTGYDDVDSGISDEEEVQVSAAELYSLMTGDGGYAEWNLFPGTVELATSAGVHGDQVTIYVSDNAYDAIEAGETTMPAESIILKEGYDSDGELEELVVMYKVEGYNPDDGDWFWALYSPEGDVSAEGKVSGCINCHQKKRSNDFVFTGA